MTHLLDRLRGRLLGPRPYGPLVELRSLFGGADPPPDVLYLGDSVLERVSRDDRERRSLPDLVQAQLGRTLRVASISHTAGHLSLYRDILRCLDPLPGTPRIVVLPINLRSFSPQWDLEPAYQFASEMAVLRAFRADPTASIKVARADPSPAEYERFDATPVSYQLSSLDRVGQFRLLIGADPKTESQRRFRREQIFIYHYAYALTGSHRKVLALADCLTYLRERRMRALAYVTPINHEAASRYVGSGFTPVVRQNVELLESVIAKNGDPHLVAFADLRGMLPSSCFFHEDFLNEHLNSEGRRRLARVIVARLGELLERN